MDFLQQAVFEREASMVSLSATVADLQRQRDELVRLCLTRAHSLTPFLTHETQSRGRLHAHGMASTQAVALLGGDWRGA
eukprot:scaffold139383_cov401-Phaeocystis_antarctica.AAC.1